MLGDNVDDRTLDGNDKLDGGAADDGLHGYGGSDTLIGGSGDDIIDAQSNETVTPQTQNTIKGGSGDDDIQAANGVPDTIDCGTGSEVRGDFALVDATLDKVAKNCEEVTGL